MKCHMLKFMKRLEYGLMLFGIAIPITVMANPWHGVRSVKCHLPGEDHRQGYYVNTPEDAEQLARYCDAWGELQEKIASLRECQDKIDQTTDEEYNLKREDILGQYQEAIDGTLEKLSQCLQR